MHLKLWPELSDFEGFTSQKASPLDLVCCSLIHQTASRSNALISQKLDCSLALCLAVTIRSFGSKMTKMIHSFHKIKRVDNGKTQPLINRLISVLWFCMVTLLHKKLWAEMLRSVSLVDLAQQDEMLSLIHSFKLSHVNWTYCQVRNMWNYYSQHHWDLSKKSRYSPVANVSALLTYG